MRKFTIAAMTAALLFSATPASANETGRAVGLGLATVVANVFYVPAKLSYAVLGGTTGLLAYVVTVGNADVVGQIWEASMTGDYVLSSQMVSGEAPIHFSGPSGPPPAPSATGAGDGF